MDSLITLTSYKPFTFFSFSNSLNLNPSSFSLFKFKKTTKKTSLAINSINPQNPNSIWINHTPSIKPFSYLLPFFNKLKQFALKPSKKAKDSIFFQNGAFGTALMSVTANAKVKISPFVATLAKNPTFVSGFCALVAAQSMKVLLNFCVEKKWDFRIMFGSGGMPSSHSALCTALTTSVGICHGVNDSLFPVCLGFSLIVMYDAIGVRRHAGMQAQVLNLIIEDLFQGHPISQRKLKELLGHTPLQVFAGALLGILVAWMCCQGCISPL